MSVSHAPHLVQSPDVCTTKFGVHEGILSINLFTLQYYYDSNLGRYPILIRDLSYVNRIEIWIFWVMIQQTFVVRREVDIYSNAY